jgi:hypothetical protein
LPAGCLPVACRSPAGRRALEEIAAVEIRAEGLAAVNATCWLHFESTTKGMVRRVEEIGDRDGDGVAIDDKFWARYL